MYSSTSQPMDIESIGGKVVSEVLGKIKNQAIFEATFKAQQEASELIQELEIASQKKINQIEDLKDSILESIPPEILDCKLSDLVAHGYDPISLFLSHQTTAARTSTGGDITCQKREDLIFGPQFKQEIQSRVQTEVKPVYKTDKKKAALFESAQKERIASNSKNSHLKHANYLASAKIKSQLVPKHNFTRSNAKSQTKAKSQAKNMWK